MLGGTFWRPSFNNAKAATTPVRLNELMRDLDRDGAVSDFGGSEAHEPRHFLGRGVEIGACRLRDIDVVDEPVVSETGPLDS